MQLLHTLTQFVRHLRLRAHSGVTLETGGAIGAWVLMETGAGQVDIGDDCILSIGSPPGRLSAAFRI